ncbi:MAG: hypothetical protein ACRELY_11320 [Polyangiaceae bacterium]
MAAFSTLAAAGACGGVVDGQGLHGSVANCQSGDDDCGGGLYDSGIGGGIVYDASNPCAQGCGLVPSTYDGGDEDADTPEDGGPVGLVVEPDGGDEDDAAIVIGVVPNR